jgi:hypothetical protein
LQGQHFIVFIAFRLFFDEWTFPFEPCPKQIIIFFYFLILILHKKMTEDLHQLDKQLQNGKDLEGGLNLTLPLLGLGLGLNNGNINLQTPLFSASLGLPNQGGTLGLSSGPSSGSGGTLGLSRPVSGVRFIAPSGTGIQPFSYSLPPSGTDNPTFESQAPPKYTFSTNFNQDDFPQIKKKEEPIFLPSNDPAVQVASIPAKILSLVPQLPKITQPVGLSVPNAQSASNAASNSLNVPLLNNPVPAISTFPQGKQLAKLQQQVLLFDNDNPKYSPVVQLIDQDDPDRYPEDFMTSLGNGKGSIQRIEHLKRQIVFSKEDLETFTKPLDVTINYLEALQFRYETLQKNIENDGAGSYVDFYTEKYVPYYRYNPTYYQNLLKDTTAAAMKLSLNKSPDQLLRLAFNMNAYQSYDVVDTRLLQMFLILRSSTDLDSQDNQNLLLNFYIATDEGYKCQSTLEDNDFVPSIVKNIFCERKILESDVASYMRWYRPRGPDEANFDLTYFGVRDVEKPVSIQDLYEVDKKDDIALNAYFNTTFRFIWNTGNVLTDQVNSKGEYVTENQLLTNKLVQQIFRIKNNEKAYLPLELSPESLEILQKIDKGVNNSQRMKGFAQIINGFVNKYLYADFLVNLNKYPVDLGKDISQDVLDLFKNGRFNSNLALDFLKDKKGKFQVLRNKNPRQYKLTLEFIKQVYIVVYPLFDDYVYKGSNSKNWIDSLNNTIERINELDKTQDIVMFDKSYKKQGRTWKQWMDKWKLVFMVGSSALAAYTDRKFLSTKLNNTLKSLYYYKKNTILVANTKLFDKIIRAIICPCWSLETLKSRMNIEESQPLRYFDVVEKVKIIIPDSLLQKNVFSYVQFKKKEGKSICFCS